MPAGAGLGCLHKTGRLNSLGSRVEQLKNMVKYISRLSRSRLTIPVKTLCTMLRMTEVGSGDKEGLNVNVARPRPISENISGDEIRLGSELGHGRCGAVYEAIFRGDRVATKIGDIWKYPRPNDE